jgi:hypothetical protein
MGGRNRRPEVEKSPHFVVDFVHPIYYLESVDLPCRGVTGKQRESLRWCGAGSAVHCNPSASSLVRCFTCPIRYTRLNSTSLTGLAFLVCRWYLPPSLSFCCSLSLRLSYTSPLCPPSPPLLLRLSSLLPPLLCPPLFANHRDSSLGKVAVASSVIVAVRSLFQPHSHFVVLRSRHLSLRALFSVFTLAVPNAL